MKLLFSGKVPKDFNYPEANEDAFEVDTNIGLVALSDGASESFDSKTWAKILVEAFICAPDVNPEWLSEIINNYISRFDFTNLSWSQEAAFNRGSFASFLGLKIYKDQSAIDVLAIGDSLAVLLDGAVFLRSYPYSDPEYFKNRPELISTNSMHNKFFFESNFIAGHSEKWNLYEVKTPIVICMTDALGEWALKNEKEGNPQWSLLSSFTNESELKALVVEERLNMRMRVDDTTLLTLALNGC